MDASRQIGRPATNPTSNRTHTHISIHARTAFSLISFFFAHPRTFIVNSSLAACSFSAGARWSGASSSFTLMLRTCYIVLLRFILTCRKGATEAVISSASPSPRATDRSIGCRTTTHQEHDFGGHPAPGLHGGRLGHLHLKHFGLHLPCFGGVCAFDDWRACMRDSTHAYNHQITTHAPIPVATLRANEAKGSGCSSLSSRVKLFTSALGRSAPGRRPCVTGSPPGVYCVVGRDHWADPSSTHAIASLNPRRTPTLNVRRLPIAHHRVAHARSALLHEPHGREREAALLPRRHQGLRRRVGHLYMWCGMDGGREGGRACTRWLVGRFIRRPVRRVLGTTPPSARKT